MLKDLDNLKSTFIKFQEKQYMENEYRLWQFNSSISRWFFAIAILFICYLVFRLIEPFLISAFLAMVIVIIANPFYKQLLIWLKGRRIFSSILTCMIFFFIMLLPLFILSGIVASQALELYNKLTYLLKDDKWELFFRDGLNILTPYLQFLHDTLGITQRDILKNSSELIRKLSNLFYVNITVLLRGVTNVVIGCAEVFFVTFYLLMDGSNIVNKIFALCPWPIAINNRIRSDIFNSLRSTLWSTIALAIIQGLANGLSFWFFGLPSALFWGSIMVFASVVPLLGTALIWFPASVYLLIMGHIIQALGIIGWCLLTALICDNILRPKLLGGSQKIHPLLVFFSVLGGLNYFGILGLILGPLIIAVFMSLLDIYERYFLNENR